MDIEFYKRKLEEAGLVFESGLSEDEAGKAESFYDFMFPPDLKEFLMFALPVSHGFSNWRDLGNPEIKEAFDWIYEGINFDIEHNAFWLDDWGNKPTDLRAAFSIAKKKIDAAPKLIPIYAHRYIPASPHERDNPVFSVYQTDIIYYGRNLWNYFENEFRYYFQTPFRPTNEPYKQIEFWSLFAEDLI